nr:MAG TPA: hypothetical protein [Caudoviricetes sp.]
MSNQYCGFFLCQKIKGRRIHAIKIMWSLW